MKVPLRSAVVSYNGVEGLIILQNGRVGRSQCTDRTRRYRVQRCVYGDRKPTGSGYELNKRPWLVTMRPVRVPQSCPLESHRISRLKESSHLRSPRLILRLRFRGLCTLTPKCYPRRPFNHCCISEAACCRFYFDAG